MGSDPLTTKKPVKRFNLPNSPGSAPTQPSLFQCLPRSPLFSPSSLRPSAAASSRFRRVAPKFRRKNTGFRPECRGSRCWEGAAAYRCIPTGFRCLTGEKPLLLSGFRRWLGKERYERVFCDGDAC